MRIDINGASETRPCETVVMSDYFALAKFTNANGRTANNPSAKPNRATKIAQQSQRRACDVQNHAFARKSERCNF